MNFRELNLNKEYRSWCDDITKDFFNPVLKRTVIYKRAVGLSLLPLNCLKKTLRQ